MGVRKRAADKQHRWLSQVESTGIVFSEPALAEAEPAGFRMLEKKELADFYKAREIWNLPKGMAAGDPEKAWVNFVIEGLLKLKPDYWLMGAAIPASLVASLPTQRETLRPSRALIDEGEPVLLFFDVPRSQSLDKAWENDGGGWKASPTTKMERLLRETGVELGLLTNGEAWRLVVASPSETAAWLTWTAQTWADSPITLAAFINLFGATRFFAGPRESVALELVKKSRICQLEVADKLGHQLREALRIFVHEIDRIDDSSGETLLEGYSEIEIYEACVTLMMRLVFIFYAEENALLPHGNVSYDCSFGAIHLLNELESKFRLSPESLEQSCEAYARLLALFRLIHEGCPDPDINVAAHGGRLFDPNRFPMLEGRLKNDDWVSPELSPLPIRDSVIREILRSLKYALGDGGIKQWVSYRTLSVEQIGAMYEGLLDVKLERAPKDDSLFEMHSSDRGAFLTVRASELQGLEGDDLAKFLSKKTGKTKNTVQKVLELSEKKPHPLNFESKSPELLKLVKPFARLVKQRGTIRPNGLFMTTGDERRATGTHYTPPELTEPIVRYTLEPLVHVGENGKIGNPLTVKAPKEILSLNLCDMAMGSGAFLVQAIRYLSRKLIEAWDAAMASSPGKPLTLPYAEPVTGDPSEHIMPGSGNRGVEEAGPDHRAELEIWAKRYVAINCIYGVDINHLAVEMAKLSIWLETHSKGKPFTFIDHALKCGDSMVGADMQQISNWSLAPNKATKNTFFNVVAESLIKDSLSLRKHVLKKPEFSAKDANEKAEKLKEIEKILDIFKLGGDLLVASFFGADRPQLRNDLSKKLKLIYFHLISDFKKTKTISGIEKNPYYQKAIDFKNDFLKEKLVFHWPLEFPEVFENGGFEAIIGNPPFIWGNRISSIFGDSYRDWLLSTREKALGNADLAAHFLRQAFDKIRQESFLGLITTNTIAETDTMEMGLKYLLSNGACIINAIRDTAWPGSASVRVSLIIIKKGDFKGLVSLEKILKHAIIGSDLRWSVSNWDPKKLMANSNKSFKGVDFGGKGFILTNNEKEELVKKSPTEEQFIWPIINASELTSDPYQIPMKYIINFTGLSFEEASIQKHCMQIVKERVLPYRSTVKRKANRERWWLYNETRPGLYNAISTLDRVLVNPVVAKWITFSFLPSRIVFTNALNVYPFDKYSFFALLQSSIHEIWALRFKSSLRTDTRYNPTDCFETFPFPEANKLRILEEIGEAYYKQRKSIMINKKIGITNVYNKFHDKACLEEDIIKLREAHTQMDRSVIEAYGWGDIKICQEWLPINPSAKNSNLRYSISQEISDELLKRLLDLNKERFLSKNV